MLSNDSNLAFISSWRCECSHKKEIPKNKFNDKAGKEKRSKNKTNVCRENISFLFNSKV